MTSENHSKLLGHTARIVASHCANNQVEAAALGDLIGKVFRALNAANTGDPTGTAEQRPQPAVPARRSVYPDYIVCLEDGKKLKMLRRYLRTTYGLTPEQYRLRWDLPASYPMVAPKYAERRSALARESGLGVKKQAASSLSHPEPVSTAPVAEGPRRRGRKGD